ncbi:lipid biosynthesis B12-binding/radical SAM protein [Halodesulfovibrio spirochaetisodalis]|uniref:Uncharacterized protein n=1 Tax=Halodesulfovibrio spirochaetisodalis TaxID=1560234 RepID=A0A1B7XBI5_9BACT|nr:lipid biosynthesis B12-binding/radical SAM protein [Halodesulfovibrio spirochaetisodalis]OBQ50110.1 hypothetical protein SP90_10730 [Halodesulfovibrio spirochaetisodalis]
MARILLIGCNQATSPYHVFPLGLAQVAGALNSQGHEVRQIDILSSELSIAELLAKHASFEPHAIGVSVRNIDDVDSHNIEANWYLAQTRNVIVEIKKQYAVPVILGGAGFSLMAEKILEFTGADVGVIGEGETAMPELIKKLSASNWQATALPRVFSAPLLTGDKIPAPLIDHDMGKFYAQKTGIMGIQSKRGCPYGCAYCSYPLIEGAKLRCREPESVAEQMERAHKDFGVSHFVFCDSVFNDKQGHFLQVAEAIKKRSLPVHWSGYFRPSHMTKDELEFLQSAGLNALEIGTDSASDATLEGMNKPFTFDDVHHFNSLCTELELAAAHFIIMGGPKEDRSTVKTGLRNIKALTRSVVFVYQGARVLPGTRIEKIARDEGVIAPQDSLLRPVYYHSPLISEEEVKVMLEADFAGDITRLFPPSKADKMDKALRSMGHKGILWDKLLARPTGRTRQRSSRASADRGCNG